MQQVVALILLLVAAQTSANHIQKQEQSGSSVVESGEYLVDIAQSAYYRPQVAYYYGARQQQPAPQEPLMAVVAVAVDQYPTNKDIDDIDCRPSLLTHDPPTTTISHPTELTVAQSQPEQSQSAQQAPVRSPVEVSQQAPAVVVESSHSQPQFHYHHQQQSPSMASYYAPAGLMQVVGAEQPAAAVSGQQQPNKPAGLVRTVEQYGQPESAGLPPNYKPFGSWGLYIGGNPADGYYTNYYKALSSSVADKQQVAGGEQQVKPAAVSQTAALSPMLRQASSSPYVGADYYPFAYSPSDLNSAVPSGQVVAPLSPVQAGAQVYGAPSSVFGSADASYYGSVSPYADAYATKKIGAATYARKEPVAVQQQVVQQVEQKEQLPSKGYQSRVHVYPSGVGQLSAPVAQQQHVVAYPVPVGSQIVGSQAGIDGAFAPYGVHAFTRYAVKPTVVNQEPASYYYSPVHAAGQQQHYSSGVHHYQQQHQAPVYRQQQVYSTGSHQVPVQAQGAGYYPFSYYGYPMSQLHYSAGGVSQPEVGAHHGLPVPSFVEASSSQVEKVENEENNKPVNKPQN